MKTRTHPNLGRRAPVAAAAALLIICASALSATARQDAGEPTTTAASPASVEGRCGLSRVGTQFVRCDNLTGNDVEAPSWVDPTSPAPHLP